MPIKNKHSYSPSGVIAHMRESNGVRYTCSDIAATFRVPSADMRMMLMELAQSDAIEMAVVGRNKVYFIRTAAEKSALSNMVQTQYTTKVYAQHGAAWDAVRARIADSRAIQSLHMERPE
ncbi:hypothetical protein [Glaciimonas sp. PCH181]|uniref:hypothetical protein n=1 Tax=Glaciimonas sp. PCH181 TaxID=2133943 RepID=UPI000D3B0D87|nr:hypothetical protein [Glaciimonas sp. PCH181]PUA19599.1 hypothetical protein C7W93_07075 [Glaciimonas sp. PCH181]